MQNNACFIQTLNEKEFRNRDVDPVDWQTNQVNISRYVLTQSGGQADIYALNKHGLHTVFNMGVLCTS
jgi:hypothetical protein